MMYAIDFGTSNSLLGAANRAQIFEPIDVDPFAKNPKILKSVIFFQNMISCFWTAGNFRICGGCAQKKTYSFFKAVSTKSLFFSNTDCK